MRSGTKFGGSVSPKLLRKKPGVSCSKRQGKRLSKMFSSSCPGPLPVGPHPFLSCHRTLSYSKSTAHAPHHGNYQRLISMVVSSTKICPTAIFFCILLLSSGIFFHYYSFIRPRTDPDTQHWPLQFDIATTRPLARCWKPTATYSP
jgi:hypothetical protein